MGDINVDVTADFADLRQRLLDEVTAALDEQRREFQRELDDLERQIEGDTNDLERRISRALRTTP
jgi:hypothetical protein